MKLKRQRNKSTSTADDGVRAHLNFAFVILQLINQHFHKKNSLLAAGVPTDGDVNDD